MSNGCKFNVIVERSWPLTDENAAVQMFTRHSTSLMVELSEKHVIRKHGLIGYQRLHGSFSLYRYPIRHDVFPWQYVKRNTSLYDYK